MTKTVLQGHKIHTEFAKPPVVDRGSLFARYCQKDAPQ